MYFCVMKKSTIAILGFIMSCSFLALLSLQVKYIEAIVSMRHEQFDESVKRSLYNSAHKLELYETMRYLEKDMAKAEIIDQMNKQGMGVVTHQYDFKSDGKVSSFEMRTIIMPKHSKHPKQEKNIPDASRSLQDVVRNRYVHQRALMDEVIYNILYTASSLPLEQRINFSALDRDLQAELLHNGIDPTLPSS